MPLIQAEADWRKEYRSRRPYAHLTEEQLCERYGSLLENVVEFDDYGRAFIARSSLPYWTKRLCWTEEEFRSRSLEERTGELQQRELARERPQIVAARRLWSRVKPIEFGSSIVKFGRRLHVQDMFEKGRFRIAPAASYNDPSLNVALRDDELGAQVFFPAGTQLRMELDGEYRDIPGIAGAIRFDRRCDNFYLFSAADRFDPRLFDEFLADACLVVRDVQQFGPALVRGFAAVSGVTRFVSGSVHYLDPLHPDDAGHLVDMTKNFRYEYQHEWRVAWRTAQPLPEGAVPVFVEIGPLGNCCEAFYL
jgi:hypothetical protein